MGSGGENNLHRAFLFRQDVWTMVRCQIREKLTKMFPLLLDSGGLRLPCCPRSVTHVAQLLGVCSASILAEARRLSVPCERLLREKTGASARPTRSLRYPLRPATNSEQLSDILV
jgi:hypothetical protein